MRNKTIIEFTKNKLKDLLKECTDSQQLMFKRMYSNNNIDISINEVVDNMESEKLDWALTQVERTIQKNSNIE